MTDPATASAKAATLIETLPYIRAHAGEIVVVKIGGEALEDPISGMSLAQDLASLAAVGVRVVVVHGGGPQLTRALAARGLEARFVGGLRVTDEAALELVRHVLVGTINLDLVALLAGAGLRPVGLSGADAGLIEAVALAGPGGEDLGYVGRVVTVDEEVLSVLLAAGYTPVVASVAVSPDGQLLNVNADFVAASIAASLGAAKLVYLTNVEGLYRDFGDRDSLISELKANELEAMLPSLSEGMRPKAEASVAALGARVDKVHILDGRVRHALLLEMFTDAGAGTQVVP